jgi:23S rRNA pseudouridine1911/1915/1917 synthase
MLFWMQKISFLSAVAKSENHTVPKLKKPERLSDYLRNQFSLIPTRKGMKKAIDRGWVSVNGTNAQTGTWLHGGEQLQLNVPSDKKRPIIELKVDVLYQDEWLAIVNKPAGIVVSGNRKRTLENASPNVLSRSKEQDALEFPEATHRLDEPTTGVLVIGKTRTAVRKMNELFASKNIGKTYMAVTIGTMPESGSMNNTIDGKSALPEYRVFSSVQSERFGQLNLVELKPATGRKHQLRIHCAEMGNPILGDKQHGKEGLILKGKGLYLHAIRIQFEHPFTNENVDVSAPIPKKFDKLFS